MESEAKERSPGERLRGRRDAVCLASNLTELRGRAGLTQPQLAAETGLAALRISRIENGHVEPRTRELVALAAVLGVSLDRLVFEAEPDEADPLERLVKELRGEERAVVVRMLRGLFHPAAIDTAAVHPTTPGELRAELRIAL
jgi:transcriptional regulator with XRE-family HTH domain